MTIWRPLLPTDITAVSAIAGAVHPAFPEDDAVFANRQALAPRSCFLLEIRGAPAGYLLAHPWRLGTLPALNTMLETTPEDADTLYLHDIALLPAARGTGAGRAALARLEAQARALGAISLVAVSGSALFWSKMGFAVPTGPHSAANLSTYGADACYMVRTFER